jgi:7-alpha-hydroxysteroid dehydrogenase
MDGKVVVVTGSNSGIGRETAAAMATLGATTVMACRNRQKAEEAAAYVRAASGSDDVHVVPLDLADLASVETAAAELASRWDRLDVLVNNAGGAAPMPFLETTTGQLEAAFRFNVSAPFELIRRATPHLLASPRGSIINVSSRMDSLSERGLITYGTVKAALSHMTRLLATELAPRVRVNGVAPAVVATEELNEALDQELRGRVEAATPLRRLASVEDVALTIRWLCSPAADYITGKVIEVDGGAEKPTLPSDAPDL